MARSSVVASNGGSPVDFVTDNIAGVDVPLQKVMLGDEDMDEGTLSSRNPMPVVAGVLDRILRALLSPMGYDTALKRFRQTAIIESGTVTTVSTVTTVTTVTTCTTVGTVTGLTNIDGRNGSMLINANSRAAWAMSHRSCIT
jgi:hypothetical protein